MKFAYLGDDNVYVWVNDSSDDSYHINAKVTWDGNRRKTQWRLEFFAHNYDHSVVGVYPTVKAAKIAAYEHRLIHIPV